VRPASTGLSTRGAGTALAHREWRSFGHGQETRPARRLEPPASATTASRTTADDLRRQLDIDLDDGSSNYEIEDNVSLGSTLKLREGFYRKVRNTFT